MMRIIRRWVLGPALVLLALPVVVLAGLPWPWALRWVDPPATSFMLYRQREARIAGEDFTLVQDPVRLEELPAELIRAVLVSEDDRFWDHSGVDWKALADEVDWSGGEQFSWTNSSDRAALAQAVAYYRQHRSRIRGRSTVTQQLAKNLYFTPERSLVRKAGEFIVAARMERLLGKDRILELYLNSVELGPGIFGVGAAARHYFGVPAQRLTRFQAASLAATLPHPLTSNPQTNPGRMARRRDLILARLAGRTVTIPIPEEPAAIAAPPLDPLAADSVPSPGVPDTVGPPRPDTLIPPDTLLPADTLGVLDSWPSRR